MSTVGPCSGLGSHGEVNVKRTWSVARQLVVVSLISACGAATAPVVQAPAVLPQPRQVTGLDLGDPAEREAKLFTLGDRTFVAVKATGGDGSPGARWYAVGPGGRGEWVRWHPCPDFRGLETVDTVAGLLVCKVDYRIVAVKPQDGAAAWTWTSDQRLYITAFAADRIAVSEANRALVVLDGATGKPLRRFAPIDHVLEATTLTEDGRPLALLVGNGEPRAILAQPIDGGGASPLVAEPLSPLWRKPYAGWSYELRPTGHLVVGMPREGLLVARDATTGHPRWAEPSSIEPNTSFGRTHAAVSGRRLDGTAYVGSVDPLWRTIRWERAWPFASLPTAIDEVNGVTLYASHDGWLALRSSDGQLLTGAAAGKGQELEHLELTSAEASLLLTAQGQRQLWQVPMGATVALPALPPTPTDARWLRAGTRLEYTLVPHGGVDPEAGDYGVVPPQPLVITMESMGPDLVYRWEASEGRTGTRTVPASVLASAHQHSDVHTTRQGQSVDRTSLVLSREVFEHLNTTGTTPFQDESVGRASALTKKGWAWHRVRQGEGDDAPAADLVAMYAEDEQRQGRYWVLPVARTPLLLRAERPGVLLYLTRIVTPPAASGL